MRLSFVSANVILVTLLMVRATSQSYYLTDCIDRKSERKLVKHQVTGLVRYGATRQVIITLGFGDNLVRLLVRGEGGLRLCVRL